MLFAALYCVARLLVPGTPEEQIGAVWLPDSLQSTTREQHPALLPKVIPHASRVLNNEAGRPMHLTSAGGDEQEASCSPGDDCSEEEAGLGPMDGGGGFDAGGSRDADRLILVAALVAIGFLVLVCVIIGLYCMWVHMHWTSNIEVRLPPPANHSDILVYSGAYAHKPVPIADI